MSASSRAYSTEVIPRRRPIAQKAIRRRQVRPLLQVLHPVTRLMRAPRVSRTGRKRCCRVSAPSCVLLRLKLSLTPEWLPVK
jgi:hypothetical protein